MVSNGVTGGNSWMRFNHSDNEIQFLYRVPGITPLGVSSTDIFVNGQEVCHMLTVTMEDIDSSTIRIIMYYNGIEVGNSGIGNVIMNNFVGVNNTFIGADNNSGSPQLYIEGSLDNFCLFKKVLSQGEILFLYNGGVGTEALTNQ